MDKYRICQQRRYIEAVEIECDFSFIKKKRGIPKMLLFFLLCWKL